MAENDSTQPDGMPEFPSEAITERALRRVPLATAIPEFWWQVMTEAARDKSLTSVSAVVRSSIIAGMNLEPRIEVYKRRAIRGIEFDLAEEAILRDKNEQNSGIFDEETVVVAMFDASKSLEQRKAYQREGEEDLN